MLCFSVLLKPLMHLEKLIIDLFGNMRKCSFKLEKEKSFLSNLLFNSTSNKLHMLHHCQFNFSAKSQQRLKTGNTRLLLVKRGLL